MTAFSEKTVIRFFGLHGVIDVYSICIFIYFLLNMWTRLYTSKFFINKSKIVVIVHCLPLHSNKKKGVFSNIGEMLHIKKTKLTLFYRTNQR